MCVWQKVSIVENYLGSQHARIVLYLYTLSEMILDILNEVRGFFYLDLVASNKRSFI